ncbi:MAG: hypothetical protein UHM85_06005 [Acutalibacteraceae bacterium]|nr:hypothetical protein [Acutalibacteraceae bacterium]
MKDILIELLGQPPIGFEFLYYLFSFILVLAGVLIIYKCVCAFCEFLF